MAIFNQQAVALFGTGSYTLQALSQDGKENGQQKLLF